MANLSVVTTRAHARNPPASGGVVCAFSFGSLMRTSGPTAVMIGVVCGVFKCGIPLFGSLAPKKIARERATSWTLASRAAARAHHTAHMRLRQIDQNPRFPAELLALAAGQSPRRGVSMSRSPRTAEPCISNRLSKVARQKIVFLKWKVSTSGVLPTSLPTHQFWRFATAGSPSPPSRLVRQQTQPQTRSQFASKKKSKPKKEKIRRWKILRTSTDYLGTFWLHLGSHERASAPRGAADGPGGHRRAAWRLACSRRRPARHLRLLRLGLLRLRLLRLLLLSRTLR